MYLYGILSFILSILTTRIALPRIVDMFKESNITCENYKFEIIPSSMGVIFIFVQTITLGILGYFFPQLREANSIYLMGFIFMGLLGLLDDLIGNKEIKGLKGHIKALFNGILTTGALKAILGFYISIVTSTYIAESFGEILINSLIIGLFTNLINIFDLRPGRAIKIFYIISLSFILSNMNSGFNYILFSLFGILIPYLFLDFRARAMMGDVGSNVLGFSLGIYSAISYDLVAKIIIGIILLLLHIVSEKVSFSKLIANNKILNYLDNLGR